MESESVVISKRDARRIAIDASGLARKNVFGQGLAACQRAIEKVRYVQIDTISVLQRAHHHILWTRVPNYRASFIGKLQVDQRSIFEYWAHAAAYLPISDYRFSLPLKAFFRAGKDRWPKSDPTLMQKVLERVRSDGPLMARDFKADTNRKRQGWWDWKPAKLALERLFYQGDLMIRERQGFQKVYDLPSRILPADVQTTFPSNSDFARHLICSALHTHGLVALDEITYLRKGVKKAVQSELENLIEDRKVKPVFVHGLDKAPFYTSPEQLNKQLRIQKSLRILSPFDPLIIQRKRPKNFFNFEYQIECYVPKEKRTYGYYVLPLLVGDRLVGRLDAKADRKKELLEIYSLWLEKGISPAELNIADWKLNLEQLAQFGGCSRIKLHHCDPKKLLSMFPREWELAG